MYSLRRCNLKCSFCDLGYYGPPYDHENYELTLVKFNKILSLDILKKTLVICFTGGEPLLNKDMPELMKIAKKKKYIVGMISNGLLLHERLEEIKSIGIADIQLSVYENTKKKLSQILPKVSQYFPLNASYVLPRSQLKKGKEDGFEDLIDTIRICVNSGCASFKFNICQPNGIAKDLSETIFDEDELYNEFVKTCKTSLPQLNFAGYSITKKLMPSRKFTVFFPFPVKKDTTQRSCSQPWTLFPISSNGECGLCCGVGELGNIFDNQNVINNEKACKIRESLINTSMPLENECINCVFRMGAYSSNF